MQICNLKSSICNRQLLWTLLRITHPRHQAASRRRGSADSVRRAGPRPATRGPPPSGRVVAPQPAPSYCTGAFGYKDTST